MDDIDAEFRNYFVPKITYPCWGLDNEGNPMPPKWEYAHSTTGPHDNAAGAVEELMSGSKEAGNNGWELVNYTVHAQFSDGVGTGPRSTHVQNRAWTATAIWKRPFLIE
jgi:hypothetical protein